MAYGLVAKAPHEPSPVFLPSLTEDVEHHEVHVLRQPQILELVSREEDPERLR
jgi:hypothetical protein